MKKLIKVFSLVLVLAVLCASIAAFAISSSAAVDIGEFSEEALNASNLVGAAAYDDPATIGPSVGGNVGGSIITDPNGNSYLQINGSHMNGDKDYAIFHTNDSGVTVDHGTPYAFVVFEYDTAGGAAGIQFMANASWQKGTIDAEGKRSDGYGGNVQHWNWMYTGNHVDGNFAGNTWYHHTLIVCVYSDGEFDGNLYHFINGQFMGNGRNGQKIDASHIENADNQYIRLNKINFAFYIAGDTYTEDNYVCIDNVTVNGYVGDTETAEMTAIKKAIGSSKDYSAWVASDGNYGEYSYAELDVPSANVTINANGETYTGIAPIGVSMEYAVNKIATENNVSLGGASEVTVTNLGNGKFDITDGAAWNYSSAKVVDGENTATLAISSPTYVVLDSNLNYVSHGFDNGFTTKINPDGSAIVVLNKDVTFDGSGVVFNGVRGSDTLYLNGHSIGFESTSRFIMVEGAAPNFTIAGPGELNLKSTGSDGGLMMAYGQRSTVTLKDLTLNFSGVSNMTDLRSGILVIDNVVVNASNTGHVFNLNNMFPHVAYNYATELIVNDSVINMAIQDPKGEYFVISTAEYGSRPQNNAANTHEMKVEINNTKINSGSKYMFVIGSTPGAGGYADDGSPIDAVIKTTFTVDGNSELTWGTNLSNRSNYPVYGEGVVLNGSFYNYDAKADQIPELAESLVFAKFVDDGDVKYVVAKADDCAAVYWGDAQDAEYWVAGSVPVASKDYGKYVVSEVAAGESYTFNTAPTTKFKLYMNLTLNSDFDLNVYVPQAPGVASVTYAGVTYVIDDNTPTATINGATYYVVVKAVAPAEAGKSFPVVVTLENGEALTWNVSILDYCERVLADAETYAAEQQLIKDVVAYIKAASLYFDVIEGACEIYNLDATGATSYEEARAKTEWADEGAGDYNANVSAYFRSYTIDLTSAPKIRLYLVDGLNCDITVYVFDDMRQWENEESGVPASTETYTIVNGECNGKNYIELEFKAYQFNNLIYAEMGNDGYLVFSAADYVDGATEEAAAVAQALYAYAYTASKYEAAKA